MFWTCRPRLVPLVAEGTGPPLAAYDVGGGGVGEGGQIPPAAHVQDHKSNDNTMVA